MSEYFSVKLHVLLIYLPNVRQCFTNKSMPSHFPPNPPSTYLTENPFFFHLTCTPYFYSLNFNVRNTLQMINAKETFYVYISWKFQIKIARGKSAYPCHLSCIFLKFSHTAIANKIRTGFHLFRALASKRKNFLNLMPKKYNWKNRPQIRKPSKCSEVSFRTSKNFLYTFSNRPKWRIIFFSVLLMAKSTQVICLGISPTRKVLIATI